MGLAVVSRGGPTKYTTAPSVLSHGMSPRGASCSGTCGRCHTDLRQLDLRRSAVTAAAQGNSDEGCSPASEGHPRTGQANNRSPPSYWTRAIDSCQRGEMRANPVPSPPDTRSGGSLPLRSTNATHFIDSPIPSTSVSLEESGETTATSEKCLSRSSKRPDSDPSRSLTRLVLIL